VPSLLQTGFLAVSDGLPKQTHQYGQEEVPTINMLQALGRAAMRQRKQDAKLAGGSAATPWEDVHRSRVTLLHVGEVVWSQSFSDTSSSSASARRAWVAKKMASKLSRAQHHMRILGPALPPARVQHRIASVHVDKQAAAPLPGEEQQPPQQDEQVEERDVGAGSTPPSKASKPSLRQRAAAAATAVAKAAAASLRLHPQSPPQAVAEEAAAPSRAESPAVLEHTPTAASVPPPPAAAAAADVDAGTDEYNSSPSPPSSAAPLPRHQSRAKPRSPPPPPAHQHEHDADQQMAVKIKRTIPIGRH